MEFSPLIKGTPDWNEKYNQDIGGLCAEMDAARSGGILNAYVHTKSGTAHTLTGEGAIMRFTATAGWTAGDTLSVNGLGKNPVTLEGTALPAGKHGKELLPQRLQNGSRYPMRPGLADGYGTVCP